MKIAMLAACPFPANHGTPGSIRELSEGIAECGQEVHIICYPFGEDIPLRGPILHRVPALTKESKVVVGPTIRRPLYDLQMVFKTIEVVNRYHLQILHAHGYEAALAAWCCQRVTGLPILYSGHNTMADELPTYGFIRPRWFADFMARGLDAVVPRLATRCLPHSSNIDRFLRNMGLGGRTEPVVNFGIMLNGPVMIDRVKVRQRYGLSESPVIVYSGVLDQFQRLDLLLDAMAEVARAEPAAKLLIVVTIPSEKHENAIRLQAEQRKIAERVVLTDPQNLAGVRELLAAADVAVVPRPQAPGFPIKLLNYLDAGKPCVMFASSSSQGLHDRENICLASPDTGAALAVALLEVLRDANLRKRLAEQGSAFVRQHHDRRVMANQVCTAYRHILANER